MTEAPTAHPSIDVSAELDAHRTALAFERTRMAVENSQMTALRTSLALIGFGFTIFTFFKELAKDSPHAEAITTHARNFGLTLVLLGVVLCAAALLLTCRQYWALRKRQQDLNEKCVQPFNPASWASPSVLISGALVIAGVGVLIDILMRVGPFG